MWERTITIGTAGKALAVTGWKTGWVSTIKLMNYANNKKKTITKQ